MKRTLGLSGILLAALALGLVFAAWPGRAAAPVILQAAGRGLPWVNLTDGAETASAYRGVSPREAGARPLSLAEGDFNADGAADVLAGYAAADGGLLALHWGDAQGSFLADTPTAWLPAAPDFLAAGDFDGDGWEDAALGRRGGSEWIFLPGDGLGGWGAAQTVKLPGALTALAVGEIGRPDGLADLAVGVAAAGGSQLVVFSGKDGAGRAEGQAFALPAAAAALAIGQLDDAYPFDVAAAAGGSLVILHGVNQLAEGAPLPAVETHSLGFEAVSLAVGDFIGADEQQNEIALLSAAGRVSIFEADGRPVAVDGLESFAAAASARLLRVKVSSLPADDLLVWDAYSHELAVLTADGRRMAGGGAPEGSLAVLESGTAPAAALPLRLNRDALSDIVLLADGSDGPLVSLTEPVRTFVVTWAMDHEEEDLDGVCDWSGSLNWGMCTLRGAIQEANASAGHDEIVLYLDVELDSELGELPDIVESLNLVGPAEEDFYGVINGSQAGDFADGLTITSGSVYVEKIAINNFDSDGVYAHTYGWNLFDHCQFGAFNGEAGVRLNSDHNQVRYSVLSGNYETGAQLTGDENSLLGNLIGIWRNGAPGPGNPVGVTVGYADNSLIGNQGAALRNVIAHNRDGVQLTGGADGTVIQSNYIGLDESGSPKGNGDGIFVDASGDNTIGGSSAIYGNVISGNSSNGIYVYASTGQTIIRQNWVGLNPAGDAAVGNGGVGINIVPSTGVAQIEENIVSGNQGNGINFWPVDSGNIPCVAHTVSGNTVGSDAAHTLDLGNGQNGVRVARVKCVTIVDNFIGYNAFSGIQFDYPGAETQASIEGNDLAYNGGDGLELTTDFNTISGNFAYFNALDGYAIEGDVNSLSDNGAHGNLFGVVLQGDNNALICTHPDSGRIEFNSATGLFISGDYNTVLGCTINGNNGPGFEIDGDDNQIGAAGTPNTITANIPGIQINSGGTDNSVFGNYIGVTAADAPAGNLLANVLVYGANNLIGGSAAGQGNVISGGEEHGVTLAGSAATGNLVQNNIIGANLSGTSAMGNEVGVLARDGAHTNDILENLIAYNQIGVQVESGYSNRIQDNSIHSHSGLGIDLNPEGVTANDTGDGDTGANQLQNFPVISLVEVTVGTRIQGMLDSRPNAAHTIDFFTGVACHASGFGEGQIWLGEASVTTDANGHAAFDVSLAAMPLGQFVSATATHAGGDTSEFSRCVSATAGSTSFTVNITTDAADTNTGDGICDSSASAGQQCSLRAAVMQANASVGRDTIFLPAGLYSLTIAGADNVAALGDLDITDDLTLSGSGANITAVDSAVADRVFEVRNSAQASIAGISIQGGAPGTSSNGGGVLVNSNTALTLDAVTLQNNSAPGGGGGLYSSGAITLTNSAVVNNSANGDGGGLNLLVGAATLINTTVSDNQSNDSGGGIYNLGAVVVLENVSVAFNAADADGDGSSTQGGGGLYSTVNTFTLNNSIVADNSDASAGGFQNGHADCQGAFQSAGYNLIGDRARPYNGNPDGCTLSGGSGDTLGGFWMLTNYLTYTSGLGDLQLNGGATLSRSPVSLASGLAVDRGSPETPGSGGSACEAFDQRGQPRPIDGGTDGEARCDRGAVEHIPSRISVDDVIVSEGSPAVFTVSLSEAAQITFTVEYTTQAGVALPGADYLQASGVLTFPIGSASQNVAIQTLNDTLYEGSEAFALLLQNPSWVFIADGEGQATLLDGDAAPSLLIGDSSAAEGGLGAGGEISFPVTLNSPSGRPVTVDYSVVGGSAIENEDYTLAEGQLSFAPGETSKSVVVMLIGDDVYESDETFSVVLADPVNAALGDASGQGVISDDDTPAFSAADVARTEGDSATATLYFNVTLSAFSEMTHTVSYATQSGSALAGEDFQHTSGVLTFAPGERVKSVAVTIMGDTTLESLESFTLLFSAPTGGAVVSDASATGSIVDDDGYVIYLPLVRR